MYERSYGAKYNVPTQVTGKDWASAADIAKLIRTDIKAAINTGDLPGTTKNYSVRSENYSGGSAIRILAKGLDDMWVQCEGIIPGSDKSEFGARSCGNVWCKGGGLYADHPSATYHQILSEEGRRVEKILQGFHDSYNHNGSEIQVDYFDQRYWGDAKVERIY